MAKRRWTAVTQSGGLVLTYSAGAAAGPLLAASVMTVAGAPGLFLFIATCAGAALLFGLWRQTRTLPVPAEQQQTYQVLPRTTPISAALDPLAPNEAEEIPWRHIRRDSRDTHRGAIQLPVAILQVTSILGSSSQRRGLFPIPIEVHDAPSDLRVSRTHMQKLGSIHRPRAPESRPQRRGR